MADVLKNLVVPQKQAHINDLDDINMAQSNQVVTNPSKEEVTNQIHPLTVKETADAYHAHATLKTLL